MWKTIAASLLKGVAVYSVFGILGIVFYLYTWMVPARRRAEPQVTDSVT